MLKGVTVDQFQEFDPAGLFGFGDSGAATFDSRGNAPLGSEGIIFRISKTEE